jgi:repressor LexA
MTSEPAFTVADMNRLTAQQQAVYDFIRDGISSRGYGPTVREIGQHMAIKSPNGVMSHLRALERKGFIVRSANKSRAIELTDPIIRPSSPWQVRGTIASSVLHLAQDRSDFVELTTTLLPDQCFLIEVRDDCLSSWKIHSGDQLVVKPLKGSVHGQVILAHEPLNNAFGIGRGTASGASIFFQPIVGTMSQRVVSNSEVVGVALGIIRFFG